MPETSTPAPTVVRGSLERLSDHKEQFQISYVRAIAAAAGCIVSEPYIDDGIDMIITHRSPSHSLDAARIEVQLKATASFAESDGDVVSAQMRQDRFEYFADPDPSMKKIVVIMSLPVDQADWVRAKHHRLALRHCAYWVNMTGQTHSGAAKPSVSASKTNIFDDVSLASMMMRVGQGGTP